MVGRPKTQSDVQSRVQVKFTSEAFTGRPFGKAALVPGRVSMRLSMRLSMPMAEGSGSGSLCFQADQSTEWTNMRDFLSRLPCADLEEKGYKPLIAK